MMDYPTTASKDALAKLIGRVGATPRLTKVRIPLDDLHATLWHADSGGTQDV